MNETKTPPLSSNHMVGNDKDTREKIRLKSWGGSSASIGGLDSKEMEQFEGAMHGHYWITVSQLGRLRAIPTYKELPPPHEDTMMQPFWRPAIPEVETQMELFEFGPVHPYNIPSITIQHLCGYRYTAENYKSEAERLLTWGFECLRSRRREDGQYYELWLLPSLSFAKAELKAELDTVKEGEGKLHLQLEKAVNFLCRKSSFGTLDVSVQRAAMTLTD